MQNDCLLLACITNLSLVQAASTLSRCTQAVRPTLTRFWIVLPLLSVMLPSACHDIKVSVFEC